jgi:hypothetical protein
MRFTTRSLADAAILLTDAGLLFTTRDGDKTTVHADQELFKEMHWYMQSDEISIDVEREWLSEGLERRKRAGARKPQPVIRDRPEPFEPF